MVSAGLARQSIKAKVTLATVGIFLASFWSLAFYANRLLRSELQNLLGNQQAASVAVLAAGLNHQVLDRMAALNAIAPQAGPALAGPEKTLQALLEERPLLPILFNSGTFVTGTDGTAIAAVPAAMGRRGVNYLVRDAVVAALAGQASVGRPVQGIRAKAPIFVMAVPLRNPQGKVVGALAGVTNLTLPNFLDKITEGSHGQTGGFLLVNGQSREILTASGKRRSLEQLPAPGLQPTLDRLLQGVEGAAVLQHSGRDWMASAKAVPAAGWVLVAELPMTEAMAPLYALQRRLWLAVLLLSGLAGGVTWWLVRRQLAPLLATAKALASVAATPGMSPPLPITREDEIGAMITAFNRLLQTLAEKEQALRESEETFRTVADYTYDWELWEDAAGVIRYCSPSSERITGYAPAAFMAEPGLRERLLHPEDRPDWLAHRARVHAAPGDEQAPKGNGDELEFRLLRPDGEVRWIGHVCLPIHDAAGDFLGHRISNRDITERKQIEQALQESEHRYRRIAEGLTDYQYTVRIEQGRAVETTHGLGCETVTGYSGADFAADPYLWFRMIPPEEGEVAQAQVAQILEGLEPKPFEHRIIRKDGELRWVSDTCILNKDDSGRLVSYDGVVADITERKLLEAANARLMAEAHQRQKAESLGLMAGAIAHHFNNKLQAVLANLEVLGGLSKSTDPTPCLIRAKQATEQAAEVSKLLLIYLGQASLAREPRLWAELCREGLARLQPTWPNAVTLETGFPEPGPVIRVNTEQLQLILTHLVTNAREALGPAGGSLRLRLDTCAAAAIPTDQRQPIGWQPAAPTYACLTVADTGCGIAGTDLEKLFDPFFSTKFTGRGLGLSVVLGLVQAHGGAIRVESQPGQGSVFRVYLPVSTEALPSRVEPAAPAAATTGGGILLLVDDDDMLLMATTGMVEILGFKVLTAPDGLEALTVFRQHQAEIRCVLTDLTMPRLDGWGLLTALRQLAPNLPVILASGYDQEQVLAGPHPERPQAFLSKPFTLQQLQDAVGQALGGPLADALLRRPEAGPGRLQGQER